MKIRVENIPEEGQRIEEKIDPAAIRLDVSGYRLIEPFTFTGRAKRDGEDVMLEGKLTGSIESECSRCLSLFTLPVDMAVDVVFAPRTEAADDETEIVDIDSSFSYYDGNAIDVLREINDLVLVGLPIKPVCGEGCKGLCPHCGANLNTAACRCGGDKGPSPFDKLKELKEKLEQQ